MKEEFLNELHNALDTGNSDSEVVKKIMAIDKLADKRLSAIAKSKKKLIDSDDVILIKKSDINKLKKKKVNNVSLIKRIKNWHKNLPSKLAKKYVGNIHPKFLELIEYSVFLNKNYYQELRNKRAKEIMELICSPKYKKFFYSVVGYRINQPVVNVPETWFEKLVNKITYNLSKTYVRVFAKKLYRSLKHFEETSKNIISFDKKIDEYMANTTVDERIDRAIKFGIVQPYINKFDGSAPEDKDYPIKRLRKIQASRVSKILAQNKL